VGHGRARDHRGLGGGRIDAHHKIDPRTSDRRPVGPGVSAIGDLCDRRCSYFAGRSGATAALVATAAAWLQLPAAEVTLTRRAALVLDVGRFGVPGSVWDKPGPLASRDRERMRLHVCDVERTPGGTE
jgi:HD-GYP domain-containing protein (c-di-GMP phosphodiesterase class II)